VILITILSIRFAYFVQQGSEIRDSLAKKEAFGVWKEQSMRNAFVKKEVEREVEAKKKEFEAKKKEFEETLRAEFQEKEEQFRREQADLKRADQAHVQAHDAMAIK
jgi:hypothetical protein